MLRAGRVGATLGELVGRARSSRATAIRASTSNRGSSYLKAVISLDFLAGLCFAVATGRRWAAATDGKGSRMSDQDQYLAPVGVEPVEKAPAAESAPVELPDRTEFPQAIMTTTTGSGYVLGASYAIQRKPDDDGNYAPAPNAKPKVAGFVAPITDGAPVASARNRFGLTGAAALHASVIRAILENEEEADALATFLEQQQS